MHPRPAVPPVEQRAQAGSNHDRRERVLRHPDLVRRMAQPPLNIDAQLWNGFIPPRAEPEMACQWCDQHQRCTNTQHRARLNASAHRRALVDIAAEAYRREHEPALDEQAVPSASEAS